MAEKGEKMVESSDTVETFTINGPKLRKFLEGDSAKVKYLRLFSVPDNPRALDTMVEFMALVSDWTEYQLGELTLGELMDMWKHMRLEVEKIAVDPTPDENSETGDSKPKTKSQDGAAS